jgi:hypothetical protein
LADSGDGVLKDLVKEVFLRGFVGPTFRELGLSLDLQISSYTWHLMSQGNIDFQNLKMSLFD